MPCSVVLIVIIVLPLCAIGVGVYCFINIRKRGASDYQSMSTLDRRKPNTAGASSPHLTRPVHSPLLAVAHCLVRAHSAVGLQPHAHAAQLGLHARLWLHA